MSCYACTRKYGFFCKETGCPSCGFSFCTKCLKKEIELPKLNNKKAKVCLKCFEKLDKNKKQCDLLKEEVDKIKQTDNHLFAITEPYAAPILEPIQPSEVVLSDESANLEDVEIKQNLDTEIQKRLGELKTDITLSSDKEIAERLSMLKGEIYKENQNKDILLSTDNRTEQEKINDLLKQFVEENNIDKEVKSKIDPVTEIEKRLAALRGNDISLNKTNIPKDESMNVKKIVQKYLDVAKLPECAFTNEEQELVNELPGKSKNSELEELPFCIICNEDAVVRCVDCDNDLYCRSCFKEIHNDEEYRLHKTKNFSAPTKFKENHF